MADTNQNPQQQAESDELVRGVLGFFHPISGRRTTVVYTNFFTGKIHVKKGGLFLGFPWNVKAVEISLNQQKVDTPERITHTATTNGTTGPSVSYDTDYFIKIVDPELFMERAYSTSARQVRKVIGEKLDQKIRDYIVARSYDDLMRQSSVDFLTEVQRVVNGHSIASEIEDEYGVEIVSIQFKVKPPKALVDEANKRRQEVAAQETASAERLRKQIEEEGKAERLIIEERAKAEAEKQHVEVQAFRVSQMIASGMQSQQVAQVIANEALTNGTNPNTVVIAAANALNASGSAGPTFDVASMTAMVNAIMNQQRSQQSSQQQTQQQSQQQQAFTDWSSLSDEEYLSAEDSVRLSQERGERIQPGGRYHISYLTEAEKARYHVAAANNQNSSGGRHL